MKAQTSRYPVNMLAKVMGVSRAGYYGYLKRETSQRELERQELAQQIRSIHAQSRQTYGSPRIQQVLVQQGRTDSLGKVKRIMRAEGIYACPPHRYKGLSEAGSLETKNLLVDLGITRINQVWYADITYIYTQEGWLYLAAILDAYSKRVVGYAMAETMQTDLIIQALRMAVKQRQPVEGLIHHSDRGSQYTSYAFQEELSAWSMTASFTGTGACLDNAYIESFFATLKKELLYARASSFSTRQEARVAIFDYIHAFYNRQRLHSSLGYTSPECFERSLDNLEKLAA